MELDASTKSRNQLGRVISFGIVIAAVILGVVVLYVTNHYPRTDDAEVFANFIGIAPQVDGPLVRLCVRDNQFVKKGELLYEIDRRPYEYALERVVSEQAALEGQISDEARKIAALGSAVSVAQANIHSSEADISRYESAVDQARADVANAEQGVERARAEWAYANNNLNRIQPLLVKQFVTVDQVDKAKSSENLPGAGVETSGIATTAFACGIAIGFGTIRALEDGPGTEQGPAPTSTTCCYDTRTVSQPARREDVGSQNRPLRPL